MEALTRFEDIITDFGVNKTLLPFIGDYPTCTLRVSILNKKIRNHWIQQGDEYKKSCQTRTRFKLNNFPKVYTEFLLENNRYKNYFLIINIYSEDDFWEFINFFSQVKKLKDLEIESFTFKNWNNNYKVEEAYMKYQEIWAKNFYFFEWELEESSRHQYRFYHKILESETESLKYIQKLDFTDLEEDTTLPKGLIINLANLNWDSEGQDLLMNEDIKIINAIINFNDTQTIPDQLELS